MSDTRTRIVEAAYRCLARWGIERTSVEDVAREAGVSRATVYRYFPGGRDELINETVSYEVGRFFAELADVVRDAPDFREALARALEWAVPTVARHEVLHRLLATERASLLPRLHRVLPAVHGAVALYLRTLLAREELAPGVDPDEAADVLARLALSYLAAPGRTDFGDPGAVRALVDRLTTGVLSGALPPDDPGGDGPGRPG